MATAQQKDTDEDEGEVPDDGDEDAVEAVSTKSKTLVHIQGLKHNSRLSQCVLCTRLNPSIDGMVVKKQPVRILNEDGVGKGKWLKGEIKIRGVTPKHCAPEVNPKCPARELRIVVGINIDHLISQYMRAEAAGNFTALAEYTATVAELDETLQEQFRIKLTDMRARVPTVAQGGADGDG